MESNNDIANFTSPRQVRIVSQDGARAMIFEAGETRPVHKDLWSVAIAAGLMPEGQLEKKEPEPEPIEEPEKNLSTEAMVAEGLLDACKTLIARGNPNDFTQMGQPRTAAVKKLVDFEFTANDVRRAFEQAMFEVENPEVD
jgi:hypothetical protein